MGLFQRLSALTDDFAKEAARPQNQDQDKQREREDVLVLGPEGSAGEEGKVRGGKRFQQPKDQAAEHRPRDVPDPSQDRGGERLQPRNEPGEWIDGAVLDAEEQA